MFGLANMDEDSSLGINVIVLNFCWFLKPICHIYDLSSVTFDPGFFDSVKLYNIQLFSHIRQNSNVCSSMLDSIG